jgi:hypothetical protein
MSQLRQFQEEANQLKGKTVKDTTKSGYISSLAQLIIFLHKNYRDLIEDDFAESVLNDENGICPKKIREKLKTLDPSRDEPPFNLQTFEIQVFTTFLVSLKKTNGQKPQAIGRYGTSLKFLYSMYDTVMPESFAAILKSRLKALNINAAERIQAGEGSIKEGKDPLPFITYRFICAFTLKDASSSQESLFTRTFTILSWNLMCRASNTKRINLHHMEWRGDALVIRFCNTKKDQEGADMKYPRHIYPNPIIPEICPILAIGLYWLAFPFHDTESNRPFFQGNDQYSRYTQRMSAMKRKQEMKDHMISNGVDAASLGSHSNRKGACSFCSSGSIAGPSAVIWTF